MSKNTLLSELINYISANSSGNVVISAPSSGYALDVNGTGRFTGATLTLGNATAATNVKLLLNGVASKAAGIEFQQSGTAQWYIGNGIASEDNNFELYNSNGTMAMKIIKSTNAIAFQGAATFSSSVTASGTISTTAGYGILSGGGGYAIGPSSTRGIIALNGSGDQILTFNTESYIYNNPSLFRMLSSSDIDFVSGGTQRLIIKNTGNVGIGTTSPSSKLQVEVASESPATGAVALIAKTSNGINDIFRWYDGATQLGVFKNSGNVGIGTSSPSFPLQVTKTGVDSGIYGYNVAQFGDATTNAQGLRIATSTATSGLTNLIAATNNDPSQFAFWTWTGSTWGERMRITSGGNVGIGTSSPTDYSGYTTLHINGKSGANGGVLRLTAYDSTSSANIYAGGNALNINTTAAVPIKLLTRDTTRMQILDNGSIIGGWQLGNQYSMTSGAGTGTSIVDTGITYNTGDYGGYGRGFTYKVVFNGNPNGGGSAAYFAQYMGILIVYTGWSGSAVTTYIQYTQLAGGSNIGALTLTPVFWNGSTESSSIGVYTTGVQIRLKISGYNSSYTGQDQSVYLTRIS